jgi:hypothetical protein
MGGLIGQIPKKENTPMNCRSLFCHLCLGLALLGTVGPASASPSAAVVVDGRPLAVRGLVDRGHTLVPLRGIFEALGATVKYLPASRTVVASRGTHAIQLRLGQSTALIDGRAVALEAAARTVGGVTMVPLRFVAESLGVPVRWAEGTAFVGASGPIAAAGRFVASEAVKRIAVGNQAGVLKVYDSAHREVELFRGIDDQATAPVSPADRARIFALLGISDADAVSADLASRYATLPKKETLALLGVIGSAPSSETVAPSSAARARMLSFLAGVMKSDRDPINRRQAMLALALQSAVDSATVDSVVSCYETTDNLWVTFPVQQFFAYQASTVKSLPTFSSVWNRVSRVNSLYRDNVLASLR